jgi:hypothetical protein
MKEPGMRERCVGGWVSEGAGDEGKVGEACSTFSVIALFG